MAVARIALVLIAAVLITLEVATALARGDGVNFLLVAAMALLAVSMAVSAWEARR